MDKYKPHIGKTVIETLTLGMYEDARFIFREYIQNAADQIDEAVELAILPKREDGKILINIYRAIRRISVEDNATGIIEKNILSFLGDVAASTKDPTKRKGFRGIGRLGGLGYCEKLIFETSYKGEAVKSIMTLDAKLLKKMISDKKYTQDASQVISFITSTKEGAADKSDHYFKVTLENVTNEELLNEDSVKSYLSMVAPVPFNADFPFTEKIHKHFKENNVRIDEYNVLLQEDKIFKAYKTFVLDKDGKPIKNVEIFDVNFFKVENFKKNELIALGWYGISNKLNFQMHSNNIERGLRLRKDNIGIGSEITLSRFFGQSRQNLNYIGEVHAISSSFIPNARRDYFNDNYTCQVFEKELKSFFPKLGTLTQKSSEMHNRKKTVREYQEEINAFQEKVKNNSLTRREEEEIRKELLEKEKKAISANEDIKNIKKKADINVDLNVVFENVIGNTDLTIISVKDVISGKNKGRSVNELSKLTSYERKIVLEIFTILEQELTLEQAERIKKKIAEHYN